MKRYILATFVFFALNAFAQHSFNMQLLGHYNDTSLTRLGDQVWNDVVGWKDTVKNREYMIAGTTDSIYFFDITDPSQIKVCGRFWGTNRACVNRDYYPYDHYMYTVSDQCQSLGNLQIYDMQYLPDSVVKVYESDTLSGCSHTIFIEEKSKRLYMKLNKVRNRLTGIIETHPMDIMSIEDPRAPRKLGGLEYPPPYTGARVHEAYVRNDTAYCSSENAGLFIWDVRDAAHPVLISAITPPYPANAYNHSNWLDSSGRYILFCDETPAGVGMKIYDLQDIRQPRLVGNPFKDFGSPHNAYWMGRYAYASMYYGGVQVYDLQNITNPTLAASYQTYRVPYTDGYHGCWGVWPFLPSGNILASDMTYGLFVLRTTEFLSVNEHAPVKMQLNAYPNPFAGETTLSIPSQKRENAHLEVYDLQGKLAAQETVRLEAGANEIHTGAQLKAGLYLFKLTTQDHIYSAQILKQ